MVQLEKDEAINLEDERFAECRAVKLYYAIYGRNAWHETWITRYFDGCMSGALEEAKETVEQQRKQGSVFYIREIPALQLLNSKLSVIITEINTDKPLQHHQNVPQDTQITLCEMYDFFSPLKDHSVIRLICRKRQSKNLFEPIQGQFKQLHSQVRNSDSPFSWNQIDYHMSPTSVEQLATRLNSMIAPVQIPAMDKPLELLGFSPRTASALQNAHISDLRELLSLTEEGLLRKQNLGRKSLNEIKDVLSDFGLQLSS